MFPFFFLLMPPRVPPKILVVRPRQTCSRRTLPSAPLLPLGPWTARERRQVAGGGCGGLGGVCTTGGGDGGGGGGGCGDGLIALSITVKMRVLAQKSNAFPGPVSRQRNTASSYDRRGFHWKGILSSLSKVDPSRPAPSPLSSYQTGTTPAKRPRLLH